MKVLNYCNATPEAGELAKSGQFNPFPTQTGVITFISKDDLAEIQPPSCIPGGVLVLTDEAGDQAEVLEAFEGYLLDFPQGDDEIVIPVDGWDWPNSDYGHSLSIALSEMEPGTKFTAEMRQHGDKLALVLKPVR